MDTVWFLPVITEHWLAILEAHTMPNPIVALTNVLEITFDSTCLTLDFQSLFLLRDSP